jgi:hypothetical protein
VNVSHRIRTLRLQVRTHRADEALRWQQRAAQRVQSAAFARELEALFDRLAPTGKTLQISRLEVTLDPMTADEFDRDWLPRCLRAVETALRQTITDGDAVATSEKKGTAARSEAETTLAAFRQFLATGRLPWWAGVPDWRAWEKTVLAAVAQHPVDASAQLASVLAEPAAARRLVWQFSPAFFVRLLRVLAGAEVAAWLRKHETALRTQAQRVGVKLAALSEKLEMARTATLRALAAQTWRLEPDAALWKTVWSVVPEPEQSQPVGRAQLPEPAVPPVRESRPDGAKSGPVPAQSAGERFPEPGLKIPPPSDIARSAPFPADEPVYVTNAGLVLLHPFLAPLFAELGFLEKGRFRSEAAQHRAVQVLAHLAGQPVPSPETGLLLPKILVGLAPEEAVRRRIRLTKREKAEAHDLLRAVLGHWAALKNTSPEALQIEFLQREGRLEPADDGWRLTVEPRTADVLLNRLPWGLSLVRLPWMTDWLHVNWA